MLTKHSLSIYIIWISVLPTLLFYEEWFGTLVVRRYRIMLINSMLTHIHFLTSLVSFPPRIIVILASYTTFSFLGACISPYLDSFFIFFFFHHFIIYHSVTKFLVEITILIRIPRVSPVLLTTISHNYVFWLVDLVCFLAKGENLSFCIPLLLRDNLWCL